MDFGNKEQSDEIRQFLGQRYDKSRFTVKQWKQIVRNANVATLCNEDQSKAGQIGYDPKVFVTEKGEFDFTIA